MLAELKEDSMRIEIGIQTLFKALPHVINKYNYHNKDPDEIIKSKNSALTDIDKDVRNYLQDLQKFDKLLKDSLHDMEEVSTTVQTILKRLQINDEPADTTNTTLNEENKENSSDNSLSPLILMQRQREDTVAQTPALKCDNRSRLPLRNRFEFP